VLEETAAAVAILLIIPGWAIGLLAVAIYLWRKLNTSRKE
tara:strand:+ start:613 stop:732 length:120 start_codon:yes stop_codon:yes gene_type:complete